MSTHFAQYQSLDQGYDTEIDTSEKDQNISSQSSHSKNRKSFYIYIALAITISILITLTYTSHAVNSNHLALRNNANFQSESKVESKSIPKSSSSLLSSSSSDNTIKYTFSRKGYKPLQYFQSEKKEFLSDSFLNSYTAVIEPYVDMIFTLHETNNNNYFTYSVCSSTNHCYNGHYTSSSSDDYSIINIACAPHTKFTISVTEYDSNKNILRKSSGDSAICMYVRREISELNEEDLATTMDAMYTLWNVNDIDGKIKYGENYHSASYFSAAHDFNAAQQDADHIHEGLGFLLQHIKLTNMFESAVQVVNPAVTIPYWDFTRDVADQKSIYDSYIFSEKTFGSIIRPKDSYWGFTYRNDKLEDTAIPDGRWKYIKTEKNVYEGLSNGFGYMRGPWNTNPSPYVSRFSAYSPALPSCSDYYGGLGMPSFKDTLKTAPYGPHASTHGVIGAVFGCDKLDEFRESGLIKNEDSQLAICKKWGFYMKEMYRANYIKPRTDCTVKSLDYDDIDCGFVCNPETYALFANQLRTTISTNYLRSNIGLDDYKVFRDFICEGDGSRIFVGDHLESASPSDPSFWVIHPTQERLFQAKLLVHAFTDFTSPWPSDSVNDYVCDKPKCFSVEKGTKDYYEECCYGHYEFDQLLDFESGDRTKKIGPTNRDILRGTDISLPDYSMSYIYDNFQWDHCEEDFDGKLSSLHTMSANIPRSAPKSMDTSYGSSSVSGSSSNTNVEKNNQNTSKNIPKSS